MKRIACAAASLLAALALGQLGQVAAATPASATERCEFPGRIQNNSDTQFKFTFDGETGGQQTKYLRPGDNSDLYTCDADFIEVPYGFTFTFANIGGDRRGNYEVYSGESFKLGAYDYTCVQDGPWGVHCRGTYTGNQ
ncbi:hypothetical protein [Pseudonocardia sp. ICBG601]|uniref:hypothetical protein n=1 Tax=Pseudonocardia sp. ICBG601 TaxID=2846759 RepID=UPI001CF6AFFE|nr:hypothetical protein [Pseudonocardia sp. ICBG601]